MANNRYRESELLTVIVRALARAFRLVNIQNRSIWGQLDKAVLLTCHVSTSLSIPIWPNNNRAMRGSTTMAILGAMIYLISMPWSKLRRIGMFGKARERTQYRIISCICMANTLKMCSGKQRFYDDTFDSPLGPHIHWYIPRTFDPRYTTKCIGFLHL